MSGSASTNTDGSFFDTNQLATIALFNTPLVNLGTSDDETYLGDASGLLYVNVAGVLAVVTATPDTDQPNDSAFGGSGNDEMHGMDGNDTLLGGDGNDILYGGLGTIAPALITVTLTGVTAGPSGDDSLLGGAGNDTILGQDGNDTAEGGTGADSMAGGSETDWLSYAGSVAPVTVDLSTGTGLGGDAAGDAFSGFENLVGTAGSDVLSGDTVANVIDGGDGGDTILGGIGNDTLIGGAGTDQLDYGTSTAGVSIDLDAGVAADGLGGTDSISGFEQIVLTGSGDTVVAGAGDQDIDLGGGNDSLVWNDGDGNDTIRLGDGSDTLDLSGWTGGPGNPWTTVDGGGGAVEFSNGTETLTVFGFDTLNDAVTCFAEGTMIATARGEVPVETLRAGDMVLTMHDGPRLMPLRWVGHARIDVALQRNKAAVAPIRILAGALMDGAPCRDLRVSPDHAIFLDGRLVPARMLVNGETIIQEAWCREVTYYHLELEGHGLLLSDGAVTESYLDDGNRSLFENAAVAQLAVDFEAHRSNGRYAAAACATVALAGPALDRIRHRLAARIARVAHAA